MPVYRPDLKPQRFYIPRPFTKRDLREYLILAAYLVVLILGAWLVLQGMKAHVSKESHSSQLLKKPEKGVPVRRTMP